MIDTLTYIKNWQNALTSEIMHLKKFGSNKFRLVNGRLISNSNGKFTYYFDSRHSIKIPNGSTIRMDWGQMSAPGRLLSSEGKNVVVQLEKSLGDLIGEAFLYHDPWELLEQLLQRLEELKKQKQKRLRIKKLMNPSMEAKHPVDNIKSNVHELILRSKYNPVTYVWGPPGTGKTYTLARVAANKYFQGKRVLILSHSNQAVDVLIAEIYGFVKKKERFREGDILRYGANLGDYFSGDEYLTTTQLLEKQEPKLAEERVRLMEERRLIKSDLASSFSRRDSESLLELEKNISRVIEKIRRKELEFVKDAEMVGTTLAKAASDAAIYESDFDLVILDEASMAYVPQAAFAASLGKRVIICGDFKQLPPIASSRNSDVNEWLKEDIFHKSGVADSVEESRYHPHLFILREQRRMHPDISAFTNQNIYHSLVGDHQDVHKSRNRIAAQSPFMHRASILLDTRNSGVHCITEKTSSSRMNPWQLLLSFQCIHEAYVGGARSIGYVTPYRAQAGLMDLLINDLLGSERLTADIVAATVHRFQGSERDVLIFDTVDSEPQERAGMLLTGKDSERLINVAITRTKGKFIHVSDTAFIRKRVFKGKTLRKLVEHQIEHQQLVLPQEIGKWIQNQHPRLQWMHARKLERVFKDIRDAKKKIIISMPGHVNFSQEWVDVLRERNHKVELTVLGDEVKTEIRAERWVDSSLPFPFIVIDQQLLWLGLPLEGASCIEPPFIAARLDSAVVIAEFLNGLEL